MYTPHTVTIYNSYTITNDMFEEITAQNITVLRGVFLDASKAANVRSSGLEGADAANLYIPLHIHAVDGLTGAEKRFVGAAEYGLEKDKSAVWTLDTNGSSFFVKGEVVETGPERDFQYINEHYDSVYRVTKVDIKDFGTPDMQHIECGGA